MCGIAAIYAYGADAAPVSTDELEAITRFMIPRGPDAGGTWIAEDRKAGLGSRRLAIIDLSPEGNQPMSSPGGASVIVFNGEIYNHRELREDLLSRGAVLHSSSDTEVLLALYARYGEHMVELLRGMFSFAIWDAEERRLFVGRDPYGIKPLYYSDDGRTFRAASTVKALLAGGAVPERKDRAALAAFMMLGSVPEPLTTIGAIRAVEAGSCFFVTPRGRAPARKHYSLAQVFTQAAGNRHLARLTTPEILLRERVEESVGYHLVSDVPVGIFLSGGIDSATLAALAAPQVTHPLRSITILFDEYRSGPFDETAAASELASSIRTAHTTRVVTRSEFQEDLPRILAAMDQPTIDGVNTWFVSKAAAEQNLKVMLSGVGGDEMFGSYPSFRSVPAIVRAASLAGWLPLGRTILGAAARIRRNPKSSAIPDLGRTWGGAYFVQRGLFLPHDLPADLAGEFDVVGHLDGLLEGLPDDPFARVAVLEASHYMRNQLLRDTDWASMAHSVEVRTPLVDASLLRQIAPLLLERNRATKAAFGRAARTALPASITTRPKTGFQTPIARWAGLRADGTTTRMRSWAHVVLEHFS